MEDTRWARGLTVSPEAGYLVGAALLCTAVLSVLATPGYWAAPKIVAPAVAIDLVLGLPLIGYFLLVRTRRHSGWILLPMLALGLALTRWWVPDQHLRLLPSAALVFGLSDAGLFGLLLLRLRRIALRWRLHRRTLRPLVAMRAALADVLGSRLGGLLHGESAVLWYGLTGWWRSSEPGEEECFFLHRRQGYPAIVGALLLLIVVESAAVHLLLALWNPTVAWVVTGTSLYSGLWIVGDFHAARLNPIVANLRGLDVVVGIRWQLAVSWDNIAAVSDSRPDPRALRLSLWGPPDFWIELHRPVVAYGLLGSTRTVRHVGIAVDRPSELFQALQARVTPASGSTP